MKNLKLMVRGVCMGASVALVLTAAGTLAQDNLVERLRSRIDISGARLTPASTPAAGGDRIDVEALLNALATDEPIGGLASAVRSRVGAKTLVEMGNKTIEVDPEQGTVEMHDRRRYVANKSVNLEERQLVARAGSVLRALGVRADETVTSVHGLMRESRDINGGNEVVQRVAEKLLIKRVVAGYLVEGDRLVLSFASDGSLRKIAGRWRKLNYGKSRLTAALSRSAAAERALGKIEERSLQESLVIEDGAPIRVRTRLVPTPSDVPGEFVLVPTGRVDVPIVGPSGSTTTYGLDFDL